MFRLLNLKPTFNVYELLTIWGSLTWQCLRTTGLVIVLVYSHHHCHLVAVINHSPYHNIPLSTFLLNSVKLLFSSSPQSIAVEHRAWKTKYFTLCSVCTSAICNNKNLEPQGKFLYFKHGNKTHTWQCKYIHAKIKSIIIQTK